LAAWASSALNRAAPPRKILREKGVDPIVTIKKATRLASWAATAGVFAAVLAGCSSGSGGYGAGSSGTSLGAGRAAIPAIGPSALDGVPAAAARTLTQRAAIGIRLEGAQAFGPVQAPVYAQGPFDFATGQGSEVIDLPEVRNQEPGTEQAIFFPTRVYLQPRGVSLAVLPKGKQWMSATIAGSESVNTNFPEFVVQVEGINPMLLLSELAWGATSSVPLGPARQIVDHVPAQRFRVEVDLTQALARAGGPAAAAISQAIQEQLTGQGSPQRPTVSIEAWVDRAGRVVQMQTTVPGIGEGTALVAVSYFGRAVEVSPPSPSKVIDITALTPSGERENSGGGDSDGA
jgi:hypothetical protein